MGAGLKRAFAAAKATRRQTTGKEIDVRVWFPPGKTFKVYRVLARDDDNNVHELEVLSTRPATT